MRTNLPVTQHEYIMRDDETIVSKTDLKGRITYANDDFIRISGYSEQELIGTAQNIVRHPDMPPEAFADFWQVIQSGRVWTGLVKNRCKNGDFYWVEATASPLVENGKVVGYTSIRVKPSRQQVQAAEQAYRSIRSGDSGLVIRNGNAVPRSNGLRLPKLSSLSIAWQFRLLLGLMAFVLLIMVAADLAGYTRFAMIASAVGMIVPSLYSQRMYARMHNALQGIEEDIHAMSSGDLSGRIQVNSRDEIGRISEQLRVLQTNIRLMIGQIKQSTGHVSRVAEEISECSHDLADHTQSQKSSLEETTSSMEELTSTVRQNASNSEQASDLAIRAADVAERGGNAVAKVVQTMGAIKAGSGKIADIISVIDGIAFQTNILALNAAVEAARAGEQGRGFAVVAGEVRALAQRSAEAAKEIKHLIQDSVMQVENGAELVDEAGTTIDGLVNQVKKVAALIQEVTTASHEQSSGLELVNHAVIQIDDMTEQNGQVVDNATASAIQLKRQARELSSLIDSFTLHKQASVVSIKSRPAGKLPGSRSGNETVQRLPLTGSY